MKHALAALLVLCCVTPVASAARDAPSLTLITGDRVSVSEGRVRTVHPGPGRSGVTFRLAEHRGHSYVFPLDAEPLVRSGRLDRRLFDVTTLLRSRLPDGTIPLLVGGRAARANWRSLRASSERVWLDGLRTISLDRSVAQIGAPAAWRSGYTGTGVKVAVLDTGVDASHPDLAGREVVERNFTDAPDNTDAVGHGTHVAATIASAGTRYRGVAPDARLLDGKVCTHEGCRESAVLDGMRWAVEQGADIVNLSLSGDDTPELDPLEEAVNTLSATHGTLFVIAAGNKGAPETVGSPGSADAALTVGAVDRDDRLADFSSRGPRSDGAIKPDVTAPGVDIAAARAGTTGHVTESGTSMATPHVAGAAALLKQQHPDWSGAVLKAALMSSAVPGNPFESGAGRIDLARAVSLPVVASSSLHLGRQPWPHSDDVPVTGQLTYRNPAGADVSLDLRLDTSAPPGLFSLGAARITVPAGGTASVTITADTRIGSVDGTLVAAVLASGVRTLVSVHREQETYELTVVTLRRDGTPAENHPPLVLGVEAMETPRDAKLRLPKGHYVVNTTIDGCELVYPALHLTQNTTIVLDARLAEPVAVTAPERVDPQMMSEIFYERRLGTHHIGAGFFRFTDFGRLRTAHIGPPLPAGEFATKVGWQAVGAAGIYRFAWELSGRYPTGFQRAPQSSSLARVETMLGPVPPGRTVRKGLTSVTPGVTNGMAGMFRLTGRSSVELVTTATGWTSTVEQRGVDGRPEYSLSGPPVTYASGHTHRDRVNYGVFGPSAGRSAYPYLSRTGDEIVAEPSLFGDNAGGRSTVAQKSGRMTLYRDGVKVGESPDGTSGRFTVPPSPGTYRLETSVTRDAILSTRVAAAWTFHSSHVDSGTPLPLSAIRFTPLLSEDNALPAGHPRLLPISVQQQEGAANGSIWRIEVDASFDDGVTWWPAPVVGQYVLVAHPRLEGFASLRVRAWDSLGNTAEHIVIRAYRIALGDFTRP